MDSERRVVVGVDRSPSSRDALRYGLAAAARRGALVEVVATYPLPMPWTGGHLSVPDPAKLYAETSERTAAFLDGVLQSVSVAESAELRGVETRLVIAEGPAGAVLLERSRGADLLVVGSRGRGAVHASLLGSVALHCASQAICPVVVVHADGLRSTARPAVVVGIDGSQHSRAALLAALGEAQRSGCAVEAVAVYGGGDQWTELYAFTAPSHAGIRSDVERGAGAMVQEVVESFRASGGGPVEVTTMVVEGRPSEVLVQRSRDARLLVLGGRGFTGVRGLLLGSVTLRCLTGASCPVMVLHPRLHSWEQPEESPRSAAGA